MDDIRKKKLEKVRDARAWTAVEVLESVVEELKPLLETHEIRMGVSVWVREKTKEGDSCWLTKRWCSGVTHPQLMALAWDFAFEVNKEFEIQNG
jgi:hypothetical protein